MAKDPKPYAPCDEHLKRRPTATNVQAASDLAPDAVKKLLDALVEATGPLAELAAQETPPTPDQLVDAVVALRSASDGIRKLEYAALGVAVLGGAPVVTTARAVGVRPQTLSENLRRTRAAGRGRPMTQLPNGVWVNA
ncbi:hypothetical protein [Mycobacteroides abscessus]|uniref:hypothetical protein n=1 Tax=Mycobacteroides abscessus TaxID=36809 RepID=UPI0009263A28|nr:hypothetical protein [Mycobacteroides abscessus]SIJ93688.1 Uncharacterised protein [Mycobacteroides abscessus subsp. abscessus]